VSERTRLAEAVCAVAAPEVCEDRVALLAAAERATVGAFVVCTGSFAQKASVVAEIEAMRWRFPHVPVVVVEASRLETPGALERAPIRRWNDVVATSLLPLGRHLADVSREAMRDSCGGRVLRVVMNAPLSADPVVLRFVVAATVRSDVASARDVARCLHVSMRTVERRVAALGLRSARDIFWSIIVFRAAHALQDPECTLKRLTAWLPFPDASAVSARFRRYGGITPRLARTPRGLKQIETRVRHVLTGPGIAAGESSIAASVDV
jgi:AraC-like DNA-binding protein